MRDHRPEISFYSRGERVERTCGALSDAVWEVVSAIGGANGWYYADVLWNLRGVLDRLVGEVAGGEGGAIRPSCAWAMQSTSGGWWGLSRAGA